MICDLLKQTLFVLEEIQCLALVSWICKVHWSIVEVRIVAGCRPNQTFKYLPVSRKVLKCFKAHTLIIIVQRHFQLSLDEVLRLMLQAELICQVRWHHFDELALVTGGHLDPTAPDQLHLLFEKLQQRLLSRGYIYGGELVADFLEE